jgi:hypothetical protein
LHVVRDTAPAVDSIPDSISDSIPDLNDLNDFNVVNDINDSISSTLDSVSDDALDNIISREYGNLNPSFTITYAGFVGDDTPDSLTVQPTVGCPAMPDSAAEMTAPAGKYEIVAAGGVSENYEFIYVSETLVVTDSTFISYHDVIINVADAFLKAGTQNHFILNSCTATVADIGLTKTDTVVSISRITDSESKEVTGRFDVFVAIPKVYKIVYAVNYRDGINRLDTIYIERRYPLEQLAHIKFQERFLFICNNPAHTYATDKEKFIGFVWYKNGVRVADEDNGFQHLVEAKGYATFDPADRYRVELTTSVLVDGEHRQIGTCEASTGIVPSWSPLWATNPELRIYPVPFVRGTPLTSEFPHGGDSDDGDDDLQVVSAETKATTSASSELQSVDNQRIEIYDLKGNRIGVYYLEGEKATFTPELPQAGAYIIKWEGESKVVVAE